MSVSTIFGLAFLVVVSSTLVAGDAGAVITMNSVKVTNNENEFFDPWSVEIIGGDKSSKLTVKMPTKKELPDSLQFKMLIQMKDQDPIEITSSFCDGLTDETVGKSMVEAGLPKGKFPKECPFGAGDWSVSKWEIPAEKTPPGTKDGPITGYMSIMNENEEVYVHLEYEGELSHKYGI